MKKLLHIIASPRGGESSTLKVSGVFLEEFKKRHPESVVEELDLFKEELPKLSYLAVSGKYTLLSGQELNAVQQAEWKGIISQIERFLSADMYLISTPMWNFSLPYVLKHYIDVIFQPKYLFRYTAQGPEGLAKDKKAWVITSRGGDYSSEAMKAADFVDPYLKFALGFIGIKDVSFIDAQGMAMPAAEASIKKAESLARSAAVI